MTKEAMEMEQLNKHAVKVISSPTDHSPLFLIFDRRIIPFSDWALDYLLTQGYEFSNPEELSDTEMYDTRLID